MKHQTARLIAAPNASRFGLTLGLVLVVSACSVSIGSTSPEDTAEEAIEEGLPDVLGLELSDASCGDRGRHG